MAEPPYGVIWNRLKVGEVVPFLGAGASFVDRPAQSQWSFDDPAFLPSGTELAKFLASESQFPSQDEVDLHDLAKVSSYYGDVAGRKELRKRLRDVFAHDFLPGPLHHLLAGIDRPLLIVATNYDTLVEQAFNDAKRPYDLVVHASDRKEYASAVLWWPHGATEPKPVPPKELGRDIDLAKTTVIYKMHGTIDRLHSEWDNFVITEEDYVDFLSRMTSNQAIPAMFYEHCRERSFLFLGYSLRDWNLRVILKNLNRAFARRAAAEDEERVPSWAIQWKPTELECRLWVKRNIDIYGMNIEQFVRRMRGAMGPAK
jgi:hypothetical protein